MSTQDEGWADFTHTTRTSKVGAVELFDRFREFQGFIAGLSRKELVARYWLKTVDDDSPLATVFFDLPLSKQPTLFRKSAKADENLMAIWQARARVKAEYLCLAEGHPAFTGLTKEHLRKLARLSVDPQVVRQLPSILAEFGIILVYVCALPGMNADGAVFHLSTGHPVIAMSLRFPRLDYFWFTLLHELAHLVLHANELKEPMFFDVEADVKDAIERAANRLAKDSLVDRNAWRNCEPKYDTSERAVCAYAEKEGIHPAIVAGLLRKESGNYKRYSALIHAHDVRKIIFEP
ncbi:MAG TPA: ImmA/IrrE family metallo-endopeptidase [Verrucomicrobiae bacterium]|nr:ImmA/IrrE family metallo-endopeptidase [Verrucomicrobiae bacterium]